jgi:acetyl-CoA carboxylase carboxyltransferase component
MVEVISKPSPEQSLADAILRWEAEGYRTSRLENALLTRPTEAQASALVASFEADAKRLGALAEEIRGLDPDARELARLDVLRNPDRGGPIGTFTEYDLGPDGAPVVVERPPGQNTANIVLGTVTTPTRRYPEGVTRVVLIGDPTKALGALAEPECARVLAAIELGRRLDAPIEGFAVSAGAKIAMDSGVENMDWIARALRGIVEFTQAGGEINVVVTGINVGAQPYWNAEATMLMHTKGILVMTPDSAMVLTGKQALDYSGGVSAEDNFGIGGYDRVMGPNGQAQYWAPDLAGAWDVLYRHYEHAYVVPGERFPRRAVTSDPIDRDVRDHPHDVTGSDFTTVGDIFS